MTLRERLGLLFVHVYSGNLSVKSLHEVVSKDHFVQDSEYLETLLVAVPESVYFYAISCGVV